MNKDLIKYLQQDSIGMVVAEGLAELYTSKPKAPVTFLAEWLKKYSSNQKVIQNICQQQVTIKTNEKVYNDNVQKQIKQAEQRSKKEQDIINLKDNFMKKIQDHEYHAQLLTQELPEFIEKQLKLSGVYIGHVNHPHKEITDQDEQPDAHIDYSVPKLINYIGTSKSHANLMGNKTLQLDKGVTAAALSLSLDDPEPNQDGTPGQKRDKYVYIPNVVKNQSIHYFRLPKLGAYIAVPLIYNCYLSEKLYNKAYDSRLKYLEELAAFEKGRADDLKQIQNQTDNLKEKLQQLIEKNGDSTAVETLKQEIKDSQRNYKQKADEQFDEEVRDLQSDKVQYIICGDTLGQDRQISQADRTNLVHIVKHFRDSWQNQQKILLYKDIDHQLGLSSKVSKKPSEFIEHLTKISQITLEWKTHFDEIHDELLREHKKQAWQITQIISQLKTNTEYRDNFVELKQFRIVKYQDLLQGIFYFNLVDKKNVNARGRNVFSLGKTVLDWKNIKGRYISYGTFDDVLNYQCQGQKLEEFKFYSKLAYLNKRFQSFNQSQIFHYNIGLGSLLFIIKKLLHHRLSDINLRRDQKEKARKQRQATIEQNQRLKDVRLQALQKHKITLPNDQILSFKEEEWFKKYDAENPLKEVPSQPVEDIDCDNI